MVSPLSAYLFIHWYHWIPEIPVLYPCVCIHLSQCTDSRECAPAPLIPGSSSPSPFPILLRQPDTWPPRFIVSFPAAPSGVITLPPLLPLPYCTARGGAWCRPSVPAPDPWSCWPLLKGFSACLWQGLAVFGGSVSDLVLSICAVSGGVRLYLRVCSA